MRCYKFLKSSIVYTILTFPCSNEYGNCNPSGLYGMCGFGSLFSVRYTFPSWIHSNVCTVQEKQEGGLTFLCHEMVFTNMSFTGLGKS